MRRVRPSSTWPRWLIGLALSALVATQWLALVHGIGHGMGRPAGPRATLASADAAGTGRVLLKLITGHDEGSAFCQLLDQLSHAGPLAQVPPAPAALPPSAAEFAAPVLPALRSPELAYRARAPPFLA